MQSVIVPPSAFPSTEFGHPTFGPTERLPLDLGRSVLARGCSPRALPPPRSMCPNPAGDSSETSEESRRHAEPPRVATTTTGPFEPAITSAPAVAETREPTLGRLVSSSSSDLSQRPFIANDLLPRLPSVFSGQGTAQPVEPSLSTSALVSPPGTTTRPLIQRSTRRTKAHVASACVNCKKKHLGCDSSRPCRRCVLAGKAVSDFFVDR